MSLLQAALDEYLAARRALGYKLRLSGRLLQRFVTFADTSGATCITTDIALAWAMQPAKAQPAQWANRLEWSAGLRAIAAPSIQGPSYRRPIFSPTGIAGRRLHTSIATKRSPD